MRDSLIDSELTLGWEIFCGASGGKNMLQALRGLEQAVRDWAISLVTREVVAPWAYEAPSGHGPCRTCGTHRLETPRDGQRRFSRSDSAVLLRPDRGRARGENLSKKIPLPWLDQGSLI